MVGWGDGGDKKPAGGAMKCPRWPSVIFAAIKKPMTMSTSPLVYLAFKVAQRDLYELLRQFLIFQFFFFLLLTHSIEILWPCCYCFYCLLMMLLLEWSSSAVAVFISTLSMFNSTDLLPRIVLYLCISI